MEILVLIPMKPNLHPALKESATALARALPAANPGLSFDVVIDGSGPGDAGVRGLPQRAAHIAPIRQAMVDRHLGGHDAVLWFDADIISYPPDLPARLVERSGGGVGAPVVLLDGHGGRFYDLAGFVEGGRWARMWEPWFDQLGPVFELDSVGTVYLVPAEVYRRGGRHEVVDHYTEHYSVCRAAREMGLPVRAFGDLVARHADLTHYGEAAH